MYNGDYKGKLMAEWTEGPLWVYQIKPYLGKLPDKAIKDTETRDRIFSCPSAPEKPTPDADNSPTPSPFAQYFTNHSSMGKIQGSYGMNRWLYDPTIKQQKAGKTVSKNYWIGTDPRTNFWKIQKQSNHQAIPLFFDCRWREASPSKNTEQYYPTDPDDEMGLVANMRHGRTANVSFADGSTRTVPLPELWTLKWTPSWTPPTANPKVPW
jgi:prepilin-type processing-associated H-X9-DG protein